MRDAEWEQRAEWKRLGSVAMNRWHKSKYPTFVRTWGIAGY